MTGIMKISVNVTEMLRKTGKAIESVIVNMTDEQAKTLANNCDVYVENGQLCINKEWDGSVHVDYVADYINSVASDATYTLSDTDVSAIIATRQLLVAKKEKKAKEKEEYNEKEKRERIAKNIAEHPFCANCCAENIAEHPFCEHCCREITDSFADNYCDECAKLCAEITEMKNIIAKDNEIEERCDKIRADISVQENKLVIAEKISSVQVQICEKKIAKYQKLLAFAKMGYIETFDASEEDDLFAVESYCESIPFSAMEKMEKMEKKEKYYIIVKYGSIYLLAECYDTYVVIARWD